MIKKTPENVLIVLVGLPASGKSTYRDNPEYADYYHFSSDDFIDDYADEIGSTYGEVFTDYIKEATRLANVGLAEAIADGQNVIWDQTNMSRKKRAAILSKFPDTYRPICKVITPPFTDDQEVELKRRLESRPGKNIPAFVMNNMRKSYQPPELEEGFADIYFKNIYGDTLSEHYDGINFD